MDRDTAPRPRQARRVQRPASLLVESLQLRGGFHRAVLSAGQVMDPDALLALRVNGADLSPDHGDPPG